MNVTVHDDRRFLGDIAARGLALAGPLGAVNPAAVVVVGGQSAIPRAGRPSSRTAPPRPNRTPCPGKAGFPMIRATRRGT